MKTRILLTVLVLAVILPALALAQELPPQGPTVESSTEWDDNDTRDTADEIDTDGVVPGRIVTGEERSEDALPPQPQIEDSPVNRAAAIAGTTGAAGGLNDTGIIDTSEATSDSDRPLPPQGNDTSAVGGIIGAAGDQRYWTNQVGSVSDADRTVIMNRAQSVLSGYSSESMVMSTSTLNSAISSNNPSLYLLDVSPSGASGDVEDATSIPLADLTGDLDTLPTDRTIVVVSNNDIDSAVAVTVLRMAGYNAWIGQGGVNAVQNVGTTGTAGTTGTTNNFGIGNATGTSGTSGPTSGSGASTYSGSGGSK